MFPQNVVSIDWFVNLGEQKFKSLGAIIQIIQVFVYVIEKFLFVQSLP